MVRRDALRLLLPALALPQTVLTIRRKPLIHLAQAGMPGCEHISKVFVDGREVTPCMAFSQTEGWADVWDEGVEVRHFGHVTYATS